MYHFTDPLFPSLIPDPFAPSRSQQLICRLAQNQVNVFMGGTSTHISFVLSLAINRGMLTPVKCGNTSTSREPESQI